MLLPESVTIKRIATTIFRLPMLGALRWGKHSALDEVRHVLVQVELSDGSTGYAEAPPRPTIYGETAASICGILRDEIAPRVLDIPLAQVFARMHEVRFNHAAKGALDIALHDAIAHSRGIPLAEHLGCVQKQVRVSYILGIGTRDEVLAEAVRVAEQGVRVFKVKVGRAWDEDLATIEELQQVLGVEVALYADANECMTRDDAAWKLDALRERGLLYCEEPLPVQQIQARAALRAENHLPLIADDSAFTMADLERELALDSFDILNIKTARTGYTESHRMLEHALAARKGVMIGSQASAGLGTARAALFAALPGIEHPAELSFPLKLKADIIHTPVPMRDGYMQIADAAAVQIDPDRLREMEVS